MEASNSLAAIEYVETELGAILGARIAKEGSTAPTIIGIPSTA